MSDISHEEFERWMHLIRGDVQGVHVRLDALNGRTRANEERIAVLADRSNEARKGGLLAGGIGVAVAAILEAMHRWFLK